MKITDDDVKTRGQKEKLEEITNPSNSEDPPKSEEPSKSVGEEEPAKSEEEAPESEEADSEPAPPKMTREGTMIVTAKVGTECMCV